VRLAILTTHPIQYHASWFRALASHKEIDLEVLYCHRASPKEQATAGFGVEFEWDISLTDGYPNRFLKNVAPHRTVNSFGGLDTPEVKEIIVNEHFDAVMINGWSYKSAWQAMRACWATNTPVMVRSDSQLDTKRPLHKRITKWPIYRWFIPKLDACLAVGQRSGEYFRHYGADPFKILIVPHVVDVEFFRTASEKARSTRAALQAKWGINSDALVFVFAGKFIEKKRPMDFVWALKQAVDAGFNVGGLMVGDGPLRSSCEEFVRENRTPISFTGFLNQSEISSAYVAADFLILPSDGGETWGVVVNEAMACGCPCIVTNSVGCGPDMIKEGVTGFTFPTGDVSALNSLLHSIAKNPGGLASMKRNAQLKANEYSVAAGVDAVLRATKVVMRG
jgi:glycosyltransferase involved in cell wall biosynthesis